VVPQSEEHDAAGSGAAVGAAGAGPGDGGGAGLVSAMTQRQVWCREPTSAKPSGVESASGPELTNPRSRMIAQLREEGAIGGGRGTPGLDLG
jgi:hypothetical protein